MISFNSDSDIIFHAFLAVYLRALESNGKLLAKLATIDYQQDEANTDKPAKIAIRDFMKAHPGLISIAFHQVGIEIGDNLQLIAIAELQKVNIEQVYIPEELTHDVKQRIKQAKNGANYTNPDIYVDLAYGDAKCAVSIEVKSTKDNKIPGSSVQQIDPYEWVIFIKRGKNNSVQLTTGMYLNSITNRLPFPDRSPRPEVAFNTLKDWNTASISENSQQLTLQYDPQDMLQKSQILLDWKQKLVSDWLAVVQQDKLKSRKWFDDTLMMFAKQLIEIYDNLDANAKTNFYQKLSDFIEKNYSANTD